MKMKMVDFNNAIGLVARINSVQSSLDNFTINAFDTVGGLCSYVEKYSELAKIKLDIQTMPQIRAFITNYKATLEKELADLGITIEEGDDSK
jgi:hypothetical protein